MPDFAAPDTSDLTKAEGAVRYLLKRYVNDPDFRYHMQSTEGFQRLVAAEAEQRGITTATVLEQLANAINKANAEAERNGRPVPTARLPELRSRLNALDDKLFDLKQRGRISDGVADELGLIARGKDPSHG